MNDINIAKAKRLLKKSDKYESAIADNEVSVSAAWARIDFIQTFRKEVYAVSELEGVPSAVLIAQCNNNARNYVCLWLFSIRKDEDAVEFIERQLQSEFHNLVRVSIYALKAIKNEKSRVALEKACKKPGLSADELVDKALHEALAEFEYQEIPERVRTLLDTDPEISLKALKNIPSMESTQILLGYFENKDSDLHRLASEGLRGRSEIDLYEPLAVIAEKGIALHRIDALTLLSEYESENVCRLMCALARFGRSIKLRQHAANMLGKIGNQKAEPTLLEALADTNESPDVVARACISVKKLNCTAAIPLLSNLAKQRAYGEGEIKLPTTSNLYGLAVDVLHSLCGKDDIKVFVGLLDHDVSWVRFSAIHALRQRKSKDSYLALLNRMKVETNDFCIDELEKSLKRMRSFATAD